MTGEVGLRCAGSLNVYLLLLSSRIGWQATAAAERIAVTHVTSEPRFICDSDYERQNVFALFRARYTLSSVCFVPNWELSVRAHTKSCEAHFIGTDGTTAIV